MEIAIEQLHLKVQLYSDFYLYRGDYDTPSFFLAIRNGAHFVSFRTKGLFIVYFFRTRTHFLAYLVPFFYRFRILGYISVVYFVFSISIWYF